MKASVQRKAGDLTRSAVALDLAEIIAARIRGSAVELREQWLHPQGTSTRHFLVDDLLPSQMAERICNAFPQGEAIWFPYETFRERKKTFAKLSAVDPLIGDITDAFHEGNVLGSIREVTGIEGMEADPELYAGGISMMGKGDFLNPHIDNSHDGPRRRYRRLNLLYYISRDWQLDYGGNLELWDEKVVEPRPICAKFNRLVVMETNRCSWHSVSPVRVDQNRCCISNYYFSLESPEPRNYYHVTSFTGRPDQRLVRIWSGLDNFVRQSIAVVTGRSRGRSLTRFE